MDELNQLSTLNGQLSTVSTISVKLPRQNLQRRHMATTTWRRGATRPPFFTEATTNTLIGKEKQEGKKRLKK